MMRLENYILSSSAIPEEVKEELLVLLRKKDNCTFHCFKESGKWYTSDRGYLPESAFNIYEHDAKLREILKHNDGKWPGLSTDGEEFIRILINDEDTEYGYPQMFLP